MTTYVKIVSIGYSKGNPNKVTETKISYHPLNMPTTPYWIEQSGLGMVRFSCPYVQYGLTSQYPSTRKFRGNP